MKPEKTIPNDEPLRQALHEWKVSASLPPRFQETVWRRIEHEETKVPAWKLWFQRLNTALSRPALATGYLALLLVAGLAAGYWQARAVNAHADETLSARYVQMVDPYQMPNR